MSIGENLGGRLSSMKKGAFLYIGLIATVIFTIIFGVVYNSHVINYEGIFFTMFPKQLETLYVEKSSGLPFWLCGLAGCLCSFLFTTAADAKAILDAGKGKAILAGLVTMLISFFVFWLTAILADKLNLSAGMFKYDIYLNHLTIIIGICMAFFHGVTVTLCRWLGHELCSLP